MKKINSALTLFFLILCLTSCERCEQCQPIMYSSDECYYYPEKDTFNIGDTIWLSLSFPKTFQSDCGLFNFSSDTEEVKFDMYVVPINNIVYPINPVSETLDKIGYSQVKDGIKLYYFVYNQEAEKYINEFGLILRDTGIVTIGDFEAQNLKIEIHENIENNNNLPNFYTSFKESSKGSFNIYVKP